LEDLEKATNAFDKVIRGDTDTIHVALHKKNGEELSVILPKTDIFSVKTVREKIRTAIESLKIPHASSSIAPWVTVSIGTANMIPSIYTSTRDLISNADKALYKAKHNGRNVVDSYG
jgi:diguanylate cyclase (GGDEF)-like protein